MCLYLDFQTLWFSIVPSLSRYICKRVHVQWVEDMMQEISLVLFLTWKEHPHKDSNEFCRIAFGIAKKKVALFYQMQKRDDLILQATKTNWTNRPNEHTDPPFTALCLTEMINDIFSLLTKKEKELIFLRYFMDFSFSQIALCTGRSLSALMTMHTRIKQKLRNNLPLLRDLHHL